MEWKFRSDEERKEAIFEALEDLLRYYRKRLLEVEARADKAERELAVVKRLSAPGATYRVLPPGSS